MKIALAGLPFVVGPDTRLSESERRALIGLAQSTSVPFKANARTFQLDLVDGSPEKHRALDALLDGVPAAVEAFEDRVRISHRRFQSELEPLNCRGWIFRRQVDGVAVRVALRIALAARLPYEGGVPLHAAGVVIRRRGVVFFGPSGAGKTTLASSSPWPVLSDELVAVAGSPFFLLATGFWGTLGDCEPVPATAPLAALVSLDKGSDTRLECLPREAALRRLLDVVLVPAQTKAWAETLAILGRLLADVPVFRLLWSPADPPWKALEKALDHHLGNRELAIHRPDAGGASCLEPSCLG
jgi:hypothetical protein